MKFCMISSFFGSQSFGGDSVYIERLARALLRKGHEVHVVHSPGAFESVRGRTPYRKYQADEGLTVHELNQGKRGILDAVWSHQTCLSGRLRRKFSDLFRENHFDVIHFHNISLLGAADLLQLARNLSRSRARIIITIHDYWWICPQSLYWKYGRRVCDSRACIRCSLRRRVPPQLWRLKDWFNKVLSQADLLLFPSCSALDIHRSQGLDHPGIRVLPGILPEDWVDGGQGVRRLGNYPYGEKPYLAAAGRLVREKGFQTLIPLMKNVPDLNLVIAGDGPMRKELTQLSRGLDNCFLSGLISSREVKNLFQGARAVLVPSLFPETFGLVAAEAIALNVPVIARRSGSLPELIEASSGGVLYENEEDLLAVIRRLGGEQDCRDEEKFAKSPLPDSWVEGSHVKRYLGIIDECFSPREIRMMP